MQSLEHSIVDAAQQDLYGNTARMYGYPSPAPVYAVAGSMPPLSQPSQPDKIYGINRVDNSDSISLYPLHPPFAPSSYMGGPVQPILAGTSGKPAVRTIRLHDAEYQRVEKLPLFELPQIGENRQVEWVAPTGEKKRCTLNVTSLTNNADANGANSGYGVPTKVPSNSSFTGVFKLENCVPITTP